MTTSQEPKINLIMGWGGVRVAAYVGALTAFRDMGVSVGAVAGASAGSKLLETDFAAFRPPACEAGALPTALIDRARESNHLRGGFQVEVPDRDHVCYHSGAPRPLRFPRLTI
jgi:hypothetical protein